MHKVRNCARIPRKFPKAVVTRKVIDLFSGVGGLSLGAARAGFRMASAVELDERALASHAINFPHTAHLNKDVSKLSGEDLLRLSGMAGQELDGLIGGPPCQGFSEIGLKSDTDPRNELFGHFFRLVAQTRPAFFLAENVPGVLSPRNDGTREAAFSLIPKEYVTLPPIKVRANEYGAPTTRTRIFFIGYDPNRLGPLGADDFTPQHAEDVRVHHAMTGLPAIRSDWQSALQGIRRVEPLEESEFTVRLSDHIPVDVGDPESIERLKKSQLVSGFLGTHHTPETVARLRRVKPGERDNISKAPRLHPQGLCPTLRAGTGPERGSYQAVRPIHPSSPRVICPREAARLQGFPDWFQFHETKWHSFRQIGNSVSPLVAEKLLSVIYHAGN